MRWFRIINMSIQEQNVDRPYTGVIERLKSAGLRPTRQRLALAKLLFDGDDRHITAETLHAEVMAANVRVSLATVYNALHQFTRSGLLREVVVDSSRAYFDTNTSAHHHFFDEGTGELSDIPDNSISLTSLPDAPAGKVMSGVEVVVRVRSEQ
jgi:Fur family transcriptional regulator, iron response regulator